MIRILSILHHQTPTVCHKRKIRMYQHSTLHTPKNRSQNNYSKKNTVLIDDCIRNIKEFNVYSNIRHKTQVKQSQNHKNYVIETILYK